MKPFLRPTSRARLAPVGWVSERAGVWAGREVDVVYDPARHQVVLLRNDPGGAARAELADAGYRRCASDGRQEMWVRDTSRAAAANPERPTPAPAHGQRRTPHAVGGGGRAL